MAIKLIQYPHRHGNVPLRLATGHFATSHSHLNYYIDMTMTKHRLSEARDAAAELCSKFSTSTVIDTILCLDGYESYSSRDCPLCRAGVKLDALVNSHGISSF